MADTAVAINEFGEIPLDQHLIDHGEDKTVVMANGCLCCNLAGDMEDAVMRIFSRRESGAIPHFDRLIVEPSGLADPAPIAQAILRQPTLSRVMRLEGIVTVVDAVFGVRQLAEHPEARQQAALADVLVVTKGDLADPAPVIEALGGRQVLEVRHGAVDPAALFSASFLDPSAPLSPVAEWIERHAPHAHSEGISFRLVGRRRAAALGRVRPLAPQRADRACRRAAAGEGTVGGRRPVAPNGDPGGAPCVASAGRTAGMAKRRPSLAARPHRARPGAGHLA